MVNTPQRELRACILAVSERAEVRAGSALPLGTNEDGVGVNFAFIGCHATQVRLELFALPADAVPARTVTLDPAPYSWPADWVPR